MSLKFDKTLMDYLLVNSTTPHLLHLRLLKMLEKQEEGTLGSPLNLSIHARESSHKSALDHVSRYVYSPSRKFCWPIPGISDGIAVPRGCCGCWLCTVDLSMDA